MAKKPCQHLKIFFSFLFTHIFLLFFFLSFNFLMKFRFSLSTFINGQPRTQIFSSPLSSLSHSFLLVPLSQAHLGWHPHCSPHWQQDVRRHRRESHRLATQGAWLLQVKARDVDSNTQVASCWSRSWSGYISSILLLQLLAACRWVEIWVVVGCQTSGHWVVVNLWGANGGDLDLWLKFDVLVASWVAVAGRLRFVIHSKGIPPETLAG